MILFLLSLLAGVLTVLAPCTISLLPVIVGGSVSGERSLRRALVVTASLGVSVIAFTFILKVSTVFITVPQSFWHGLSGVIIIVLGLAYVFPTLYERLPFLNTLNRSSNRLLATGYQQHNFTGDVLIGAALGPVFSSCSPTYFLILAAVLPANFALGTVYLIAYAVGLCGALLIVAAAGQVFLHTLGVASDSHSWFKRSVGVLFVIVGVVIFFGYDQQLELAVSNHIFDVTTIEQKLLQDTAPTTPTDSGMQLPDAMQATSSMATSTMSSSSDTVMSSSSTMAKPSAVADALRKAKEAARYPKSPEITDPSGFINTNGEPITFKQFIGKKVILVDFWTYSCINCQRTIPYLKAWYDKYHDQGLEIISIHTPEFAFEHVQSNVQAAVDKFGIKYPVVLDNNYGTWNAFGNQYWPRDYLINIDGYIVHDHAGEGEYDQTEQAIQQALKERDQVLGLTDGVAGVATPTGVVTVNNTMLGSPETYFGAARNEYLGNGTRGQVGEQTMLEPLTVAPNMLYLMGKWDFFSEYAETSADVGSPTVGSDRVDYRYDAKHVYFVAGSGSGQPITVEVLRDSAPLPVDLAGKDIFFRDGKSYVQISEDRLYDLVSEKDYGTHLLELIVSDPGLQAYTFTFG